MAVFRGQRILAVRMNAGDTWTDEASPSTNHGTDVELSVRGGAGVRKYILMTVEMPPAPSDAETEESSVFYEGIDKVELVLSHTTTGSGDTINIYELIRSFTEDSVDWSNQPDRGILLETHVLSTGVPGTTEIIDITDVVKEVGKRWDDTFHIRISNDTGTNTDKFASREYISITPRPFFIITYFAKPPAKVEDFAIEPYELNPTIPKLTWKPNEDETFDRYEIYRKVKTASFVQIGGNIVEQGTSEFIDDTGGVTPLQASLLQTYKIRVVDNNGSYIDSNEVSMIRPRVTAFTMTGIPPNVKDEVVASIQTIDYIRTMTRNDISFSTSPDLIYTPGGDFTTLFEPGDTVTVVGSASNDGTYSILSVLPNTMSVAETLVLEAAGATVTLINNSSTPGNGAVVDSAVLLDWTGDGLEKGLTELENPANPINISGSNPGFEFLKHRYFEARAAPGVTPKVQVENSLGFRSDLTTLTAGGPSFVVSPITPNARLKANPTKSFPYIIHPLSGTVSVSTTTPVVTGTGTKFLSEVRVGDYFTAEIAIGQGPSHFFYVKSIESDTQLTLDINYYGGSGSTLKYMIIRNANVRLNAEESDDRNSNGTLSKFEFLVEILKYTDYFKKSQGEWLGSVTYNDRGTTPYMDVPMYYWVIGGTVTVKQNCKTVIGIGTAWATANNTTPGDVFAVFGSKGYVIESVVSDTELILEDEWDEGTQSGIGHITIPVLESPAIYFNSKTRVTNSFALTDESDIVETPSKPEAGIDMLAALRARELGGTISLSNPTDARKKTVQEIADSDDVVIFDEGRALTTLRLDGSGYRASLQDEIEDKFKGWIRNDQMLRVFYRDDGNRAYYYDGKLRSVPRTKTEKTSVFGWNLDFIVFRRVE